MRDNSGGRLIPIEVDAKRHEMVANTSGRSSDRCARTRELGFTASKHIKMYGERFELVSDPFEDGGCTAVHVISKNDRTVRTLRLPVAILIGLSDRFHKKQN